MNASLSILSQLQQGESPAEVAEKFTYKSISPNERKILLAEGKKEAESELGLNYFRVLFHLSNEDWFSSEVLVLAIQNPHLELNGRLVALERLKECLARLESKTDQSDSVIYRRINKLKAKYYYLLGINQCDSNNLDAAIISFNQARQVALLLSALKFAGKIEKILTELESQVEASPYFTEIGLTQDEHTIEARILLASSKESDLREKIKESEHRLSELEHVLKERLEQIANLDADIEALKVEIESKKERLQHYVEIGSRQKMVSESEERLNKIREEIRIKEIHLQEIGNEIQAREKRLNELERSNAQFERGQENTVDNLNIQSGKEAKPTVQGLEGDIPFFLT
ncbi:hypothetical protein ACFLZW_04225 [Chloroflexota bacterium]